jgi:hypothetical protein
MNLGALGLCASGFWVAALGLRTLGLSTGITGSFEEAFATLEAGTNSLFGAALALLALGLEVFAARKHHWKF